MENELKFFVNLFFPLVSHLMHGANSGTPCRRIHEDIAQTNASAKSEPNKNV